MTSRALVHAQEGTSSHAASDDGLRIITLIPPLRVAVGLRAAGGGAFVLTLLRVADARKQSLSPGASEQRPGQQQEGDQDQRALTSSSVSRGAGFDVAGPSSLGSLPRPDVSLRCDVRGIGVSLLRWAWCRGRMRREEVVGVVFLEGHFFVLGCFVGGISFRSLLALFRDCGRRRRGKGLGLVRDRLLGKGRYSFFLTRTGMNWDYIDTRILFIARYQTDLKQMNSIRVRFR